jgi:hypothetical protein
MKNRQYQGVQLSKKESELVQWLQKGEHSWVDAFYMYSGRKKPKRVVASRLKERVWFNSTLEKLHNKGLCKNIPFIVDGFAWRNPGITSNKSNFTALTLQEVNVETKELVRVI